MGGGTNKGTDKNPTSFDKEAFQNTLGSGLQSEFEKGFTAFDQPLFAGQGEATQGGIQGLLGASNNPTFNQGLQGAFDLTADVAAGNRFGENSPGFARLRQNAIDEANKAATQRFASSGTFGSDAHQRALGEGIANATAGLDFQNFQNDIARQERAQANLPALFQASLQPGQAQIGAGQLQDQASQAQLLADQDLFRRQQDAGFTNVARTIGAASGQPIAGSTGGEEQPSPFFDILGATIATAGAFG